MVKCFFFGECFGLVVIKVNSCVYFVNFIFQHFLEGKFRIDVEEETDACIGMRLELVHLEESEVLSKGVDYTFVIINGRSVIKLGYGVGQLKLK